MMDAMSVNDAPLVNQNICSINKTGKPVERRSRGLTYRYPRTIHDAIPRERRAASTCSNTTSVANLPCLTGTLADACDPRPPSTCFDPTSSLHLSSISAFGGGSSVPLSSCSGAGFCGSVRSGPGGAAAAVGIPAQRPPPHPCPRAFSRSSQPVLRLQGLGQQRPQRPARAQASLPGDLGSDQASSLAAGSDAAGCRDARAAVHCTAGVRGAAARMDDLENWVQYLAVGPREEDEEEEEEGAGAEGGQASAATAEAYESEASAAAKAAAAVVGQWVGTAFGREVEANTEVVGTAAYSHHRNNNNTGSSAPSMHSVVPGLVFTSATSGSLVTVPAPPSLPTGSSPPSAQSSIAPTLHVHAASDADATDAVSAAVAVRASVVVAADAPAATAALDRWEEAVLTRIAAPKLVRSGRSSAPVMQSWPLLAPTVAFASARSRTVSASAVTGGCLVAAAAAPIAAAAAAAAGPAKVTMEALNASRLTEIAASAAAPAHTVSAMQPGRTDAVGLTGAVLFAAEFKSESEADIVAERKPAPLQRRTCERGYLIPSPVVGADAGRQMSTTAMAAAGGPDAAGASTSAAAAMRSAAALKWPSLRMIGDALRSRCRVRHHGGGGGRRDGAVQQRRGPQRRDATGRFLWTEAGYGVPRASGGAATRGSGAGPAGLFASYSNHGRNANGNDSTCTNNRNCNAVDDDDEEDVIVLAANGMNGTNVLRYDSFGSIRTVGGGGGGGTGMSTFGLALTTAAAGCSFPDVTPGQILTFSIAAMAAAAARHDDAAAAAAAAAGLAAASVHRISLADGDWESLWTDDDVAVREPPPHVRHCASQGAPSLVSSGPLLDMPYGWEAVVAALTQELGARGSVPAPPETPVDWSRARLYELSPRHAEDPRVGGGDGGGARKAWRKVRTGLGGLLRGLKSCYS